MSERELPDGWAESIQRIAWHCARTWRGDISRLGAQDRFEGALSGIVDWLIDNDWPGMEGGEGGFGPLFNAGLAGINHLRYEEAKHLSHSAYWIAGPANHDPVGDGVAERVGIVQLMEALRPSEFEAVHALAWALETGGGLEEAAAYAGISYAAMAMRLSYARARARGLWIAPGDSPRGQYRARSKASAHRYYANHRAKIAEEAEEMAAG